MNLAVSNSGSSGNPSPRRIQVPTMTAWQFLAQAGPSWWDRVLNRDVLPLFIPIVAIVGGISFAIIKAVIRHRERMAMIEHGMNPDSKRE